jgi:hypothetical protein
MPIINGWQIFEDLVRYERIAAVQIRRSLKTNHCFALVADIRFFVSPALSLCLSQITCTHGFTANASTSLFLGE